MVFISLQNNAHTKLSETPYTPLGSKLSDYPNNHPLNRARNSGTARNR